MHFGFFDFFFFFFLLKLEGKTSVKDISVASGDAGSECSGDEQASVIGKNKTGSVAIELAGTSVHAQKLKNIVFEPF